jgi:hypothetical protein
MMGGQSGVGMMGGQSGVGMMGGQSGVGMMGGQSGVGMMGNLSPDELQKMRALHDEMLASGRCDPADMAELHQSLDSR